MFGYPHFIPEFVQSTNSSLFWFKIANELSEFRNYLLLFIVYHRFLEKANIYSKYLFGNFCKKY